MIQFGIQSMTGFGRAQAETAVGQFMVELRTVNNRFQDTSISLPRELGQFESLMRALLKQEIPRGKVDCRVRYTPIESQFPKVSLNLSLAEQYITQLKRLQEMGLSGEIRVEAVTSLPGVLEVAPAEMDEQVMWQALQDVARQAIAALNQERTREGRALGEQLHDLMVQLRGLVEQVDAQKHEVVQRYRERLTQRIEELEADIKTKLDAGRLEMEVALFADRSDISEELVRLRAHLDRLDALIKNEENAPAGKNLDFLVQELGREVNTIGSKVRETGITGMALEMKSIIERIREQVQNVQ